MNNEFDDSLDDLLGGPISDRPRPTPPESYKPQTYSEPCKKCGGRGRFVSWSGRDVGPCFTCKGTGKNTYKVAPDVREKNRAQAATRKAQKIADAILAFKAQEPEVFAWLNTETAKPQPFGFAVAMVEALAKYGDLTDKQLETCKRLATTAAEKAARRAAAAADAPPADSAGIDRLKAAFDKAAAYVAEKGLRRRTPKITVGDVVISPAPASGKNPGALYVKSGETYLGKVAAGRFFASGDCSAEQSAKVLEFVADPMKAAEVYGQTTGTCCICNATLRSDWKYRGIGPICAQKFGW